MKRRDSSSDGNVAYRLDNGMSVLIKEDHFSPVTAMQIWVEVGGADERGAEAGIAHVHEHMLFKGTETRGVGEIAAEVESAGGRINAWTSWDQTVYHIVTASRHSEQALRILADAMRRSSFDPTELDKELRVVLEEWKRGEDTPSRRLFQTLFATAFENHPYQRPVIGTEESITGLTREMILDFYRRFYVPNNMTLVVVGDVDTKSMRKLIKEEFGSFESRPIPRPERPLEGPQDGLRHASVSMDVKEAHLALGFHIPSATHEDAPVLDALSQILGGGESSRLYRRLVAESELATGVSCFAYTPVDPGLFVVTASLEARDIESALFAITDEIEKIAKFPVKDEELDMAIRNLEAEFIYKRQTVQGQARELGGFLTIYDNPDYDRVYIDRLHGITLNDIQEVASGYLKGGNLTVVDLLPSSSGENLPTGAVKKAASGLSYDEGTVTWAPESQTNGNRARVNATATRGKKNKPAKLYTLDNGLRIIVQEHHDVPLFAARIGMLGGLLSENPENNGISGFTAEMLTRGTEQMSREEFAREVESLAGDVSGFSGRNSIGLSAGFLSSNFDEGMDLLLDAALEPAFDPEEVEKTRREILLAIKNREDSSAQLALDLIYRTMYPEHPYGMSTLGEKDSISALNADDLRRFYAGVGNPARTVISVVGDVDSKAVIDRISERYRKNLSFSEGTFDIPPVEPPDGIRRAHIDIDRHQAHIVLGYPGVDLKDPDRYALAVLETVLSRQGGRLFYELRDVQGLAYSVTAFASEGLADGIFGAYIATDPDNAGKAVKGLLEEFAKVRAEEVEADELERAQRYLIGSHEIALQTNSALASEMLFNELYDLGFRDGEHYAERIKGVDTADVKRVADKYLQAEIRTEATVGPADMSSASD